MDNRDIDSVFTFRVTISPNKSASDIHNYLMESRKSCNKKLTVSTDKSGRSKISKAASDQHVSMDLQSPKNYMSFDKLPPNSQESIKSMKLRINKRESFEKYLIEEKIPKGFLNEEQKNALINAR